ncbi:MAG: DUF4157 domain-containing protein [Bacteroidota bacterium]
MKKTHTKSKAQKSNNQTTTFFQQKVEGQFFSAKAQAKLRVSHPSDSYEREADQVADRVVGKGESIQAKQQITPLARSVEPVQTMTEEPPVQKEEEVQEMKEEPIQKNEEVQEMTEGPVQKEEEEVQEMKEEPIQKEEEVQEMTEEPVQKQEEDVQEMKEEPIQKEEEVQEMKEEPVQKQEEDVQEMKEEPIQKEEEVQEMKEESVQKQEEGVQEMKEEPIQKEEEVQEMKEEPLQTQEEDVQEMQEEPIQKQEEVQETTEEPVQKQEEVQEMSEETVQKEEDIQGRGFLSKASMGVEQLLHNSKGKGSPLPEGIRGQMESGFGADFGPVRIHTGQDAINMSKSLGAIAFAHGKDIYFNAGNFDVNSKKGRQLLAHELTHTIQQGAIQKELPDEHAAPTPETAENGLETKSADTVSADGSSPVQEAPPTDADNRTQTPAETDVPASDLPSETDTDTPVSSESPQELTETPSSPEEDPNFQALSNRSEATAEAQSSHPSAEGLSSNAQASSTSPPNERESMAEASQVEDMDAQEAGEFDAEAFKKMLLDRIKEVMPKNEKEADEFADDNKMDTVRDAATEQVESEKESAAGGIEETTAQEPDTNAVPERETVALETPVSGPKPPALNAGSAMPPPRTETSVEQPIQENTQRVEDRMAEEGVSDEQLANSNEPAFQSALQSKNEAKDQAATAPDGFRQEEQHDLSTAQQESEAAADQQLANIHGDRTGIMGLVATAQNSTSGKDSKERARIAGHINKIFARTKADVETKLTKLDADVSKRFDVANERATRSFEHHVEREMDKYKEERYGAWFDPRGWGTRIADAVVGLPDEVNDFYVEGRNMYIEKMDIALTGIADHVANTLNEAKARITQGKQEVSDYVASLPDNLRSIGQKAADDIQSKFDELNDTVNDKQEELVDTLAEKYSESLQKVDARIEEMKAANRGLVDMALDAIGGVIETILNLKNMLMDLISGARDVITTIINDPIGFLTNLVKGVGQGLKNFLSNIWTHLQSGLIGWLTGAMGPAGITIPDDLFSLKGIFSLVIQILGLGWDFIRRKAVKLLGEKVVNALETGFEIFKILATEGIDGVWTYLKEKFQDLKATVMDAIKDMIISTVIKAGIKWIMGLLNPAGAFVKAVMMIIDVVTFFVERGSQIMELIKAFIDGVKAIAAGNVSKVAEFIENALKMALPIVIGFLANLLGIGGLAKKVTGLIKKIRKRISKAVDGLIKKAKKWARKLFKKGKGKGKGKGKDKKKDSENSKAVKKNVKKELKSKIPKKIKDESKIKSPINSIYQKYKPKGLKYIDIRRDKKTAQYHFFISASSEERGGAFLFDPPVLEVADIDPQTEDFKKKINTWIIAKYNQTMLGKVNFQFTLNNYEDAIQENMHAEQRLVRTMRSKWDTLPHKNGEQNVLDITIKKSPCGGSSHDCSQTLDNFVRKKNLKLILNILAFHYGHRAKHSGGKYQSGEKRGQAKEPGSLEGLERLLKNDANVSINVVELSDIKKYITDFSSLSKKDAKTLERRTKARAKKLQKKIDGIVKSKKK